MADYEKFYSDQDFGTESVFSSAFPIPEEGVEARYTPEIDAILAANPHSMTHETGAIQLQPTVARTHLENLPASSDKFSAASREFLVDSLTSRASLKDMRLQLDQSLAGIDSFSLKIVPRQKSSKKFNTYELRGVVDDDNEKALFEFSTQDEINQSELDSIILHPDVTNDLLLGLLEQAHGRPLPKRQLEDNLLRLLGKAKDVEVTQTGIYTVESKPHIEISIERRQYIQEGLATTTFLSISMLDTGRLPGRRSVIRKLNLLQTVSDSSASYDVLDRADVLDHQQKASRYMTEATMFRDTPDILLDSLKDSLRSVAYSVSGENGFDTPNTGA